MALLGIRHEGPADRMQRRYGQCMSCSLLVPGICQYVLFLSFSLPLSRVCMHVSVSVYVLEFSNGRHEPPFSPLLVIHPRITRLLYVRTNPVPFDPQVIGVFSGEPPPLPAHGELLHGKQAAYAHSGASAVDGRRSVCDRDLCRESWVLLIYCWVICATKKIKKSFEQKLYH